MKCERCGCKEALDHWERVCARCFDEIEAEYEYALRCGSDMKCKNCGKLEGKHYFYCLEYEVEE